MSYSTPETVVSGVVYAVVDVAGGGPPTDLAQFAGNATFRVQGPTGEHEVAGEGVTQGDAVRFHQKMPPDGKDARVWTIRREAEGVVAESA
ncbi:MAG: hypothetical protein H5T83_09020 [Actinotalea sp.]|nr:hypothetical protein [Actinotalea sp.]